MNRQMCLHYAIKHHRVDNVRVLLEERFPIDKKDGKRRTMLGYVIELYRECKKLEEKRKLEEIFKLLLHRKRRIEKETVSNVPPEVVKKRANIARFLAEKYGLKTGRGRKKVLLPLVFTL